MNFEREHHAFVYRDASGALLAEITYQPLDEHTVLADHTFVDPSLRGQGVGKKLVCHLADQMRAEHKKIKPQCLYVVALFEQDTQFDDVHAK